MSEKNFHVYKSSAGSGKTYTLVREYLSVALESENPNRYRNILAITFTNKAASEMKERVTKYLKAFSAPQNLKGGELDMFKHLCEVINIQEDTLQDRAFATLQSILHNYSDFNITTIDKFILRIIRSFSFDLQLPFNFEVELDGEGLLNLAINNLIAETGKNKKLTAFMVNYIKQLADGDESWDIQKSLLEVAKLTLNENSEQNIQQLKNFDLEHFVTVKEEVGKEIKEYESYLLGRFDQGRDLIQTNNLVAADFKGKSSGSVFSYFNKKRDDSKLFTDTPGVRTLGYFDEDDWAHPDSGNGSIINSIKPQLLQFYNEIEDKREKKLADYLVLKNIHKQLFQLGLLNEIEKQILIIKEEKNFIHISEFNKKVAEIVVEQPIPFVYERIGEKFNNYLIDEFQDTSVLQWQNLLPLVENSLAYNHKNLIVGDTKQAIYRWRGGDVDQFAYLPHSPHFRDNPIIQERVDTLVRQFEGHNLSYNYRSLPNIIAFNNLFFETLLPELPFDFTDYYDDYIQKVGSGNQGGYAQVEFIDGEEYKEDTFGRILDTIKDCLERGYRLKNIAILARKNRDLSEIAEFLTAEEIDVISSESLSLDQSAEAEFVVNIFRIIHVPNDIEAFLKACNFLNERSPISFFEMFHDKTNIKSRFEEYLNSKLDTKLPNISGLSLYECFEEIIYAFKITKSSPFVQTLLDVVNQHSSDSNASEFIQFWEEKKSKLFIATPEGVDAVSLMSIHKSKGLEFDVVIIPFANNKSMEDRYFWIDTTGLETNLPTSLATRNKLLENTKYAENLTEEKKKQMLDELNVTYVALTRAAEELYILAKEPPTPKNANAPVEITNAERFYNPIKEKLTQEGDVYFLGEKNEVSKTDKASDNEIGTQEIEITPWRDKIKISFSAPSIWNVPENSEESFDLLDPRKFGNLVHHVFAKLKGKDQVQETLDEMVQDGLIDTKDIGTIQELVSNTLQLSPLHEIWEEGKHIIEKEIITPDGSSYRPDRIIESGGTTYLIDFKTGSAKNKDKKQIQYYEKLLSTLEFKNIKSFLVYTEEGESVAV